MRHAVSTVCRSWCATHLADACLTCTCFRMLRCSSICAIASSLLLFFLLFRPFPSTKLPGPPSAPPGPASPQVPVPLSAAAREAACCSPVGNCICIAKSDSIALVSGCTSRLPLGVRSAATDDKSLAALAAGWAADDLLPSGVVAGLAAAAAEELACAVEEAGRRLEAGNVLCTSPADLAVEGMRRLGTDVPADLHRLR